MLIDFRQLFPKYNIKPQGVLHIGANVGEEAPIYRELGIDNQVWIEANPEIYHKLKMFISDNPHALALNYCIGDEDGKQVTFHVSNNGSQSSSILELGTHKIAHPEVHYVQDISMTTHRIDTILKAHDWSVLPMDFLNIDLQGAELMALKGMGDLLNRFKWAYLEVNKAELYKGCALIEDIDFYLGAYGFKRVETKWCGNTNWGDALYIK
jgi:FkbM family methyltransferase